jgi:hypothetical protein
MLMALKDREHIIHFVDDIGNHTIQHWDDDT